VKVALVALIAVTDEPPPPRGFVDVGVKGRIA
jgi:hypothetical protein